MINSKNQNGVTIIAAIFIIVVLGFMGVMFLSMISTSTLTSVNDMQSAQALSIAEGGMEYILENRTFPNYSMGGATMNLGTGNFTVSTPTYLTADPGAAGVTITVQSTATFPNAGRIIIDSELITYTGKNATQFTPATRGVGGTQAAAHAAGNAVYPVTTVTDNPLPVGNTTINVASNVGFSIPGVIVIDSEYVFCTTVNGTTQFTNCTRDYKGSSATAHPIGSNVFQYNITSTGFVGSAQRAVARSSMQYIRLGAMMAYAKLNGDGVPYYRRWDGNSWGPELTANAVPANIQYMVLKFARTRDEAVLGTLSSNGDIRVQVWNGANWGATTLVGNATAAYSAYRGFDIEYETNTDRAIIVYNNVANGTNLAYNIWNGTAWSGATPITVSATTVAPRSQATGTAVSGTGAVSPVWPPHAINDIALLFVESFTGQQAMLSTPAGFAQVFNSPQDVAGINPAGTQITVFWARATSTAMAAPIVADPGDHVYAQIITYRGVTTAGNPWDVTGGGTKPPPADTSVTVAGVTTSVPNTLIVQAVARDNDSAAAAFSAQTNANLTGITERSDAGTISGNGGGFGVWDGVKATAGATGNTTATVTSSIKAFLTIALKPPPPVWIELAQNPLAGSNEIAMILLDSDSKVYGMRWTGGAWDDMGDAAVWDTAASSSTTKAVHVAYEQQTGRAIFVWGRNVNSRMCYRIWNGTTLNLGAVTIQDIAQIGNHSARWVRLVSDRYSNNIMLGIQDSGTDLITSMWNGGAWDATGTQHDASLEDASRNFDFVYETFLANAGRLWLLWGNGTQLSRRQWSGAAWGGIATTGDDTSFVAMTAHPVSGAVLSGIYESTNSGAGNRDIWESHLTQGSAVWTPEVTIWGGRTVAAPVMERLSLAVERRNDPLVFLGWQENIK